MSTARVSAASDSSCAPAGLVDHEPTAPGDVSCVKSSRQSSVPHTTAMKAAITTCEGGGVAAREGGEGTERRREGCGRGGE